MWGPNVPMYYTDVFPEPPASWEAVFREMTLPDGQSNKGRVQTYDGPIHVADAALFLIYHQPELGIENPYELNQEQYAAALDLLREQRKIVGHYWHDAFIQMDDFKNEGIVASGSWPFQVNLLKGDGAPVASTIPIEGATGWSDTTMMHIDSAHPDCACMWMEHTLSSNLQSDLSVWFGAVPPAISVCTDGRGMQTAKRCAINGLGDSNRISKRGSHTAVLNSKSRHRRVWPSSDEDYCPRKHSLRNFIPGHGFPWAKRSVNLSWISFSRCRPSHR